MISKSEGLPFARTMSGLRTPCILDAVRELLERFGVEELAWISRRLAEAVWGRAAGTTGSAGTELALDTSYFSFLLLLWGSVPHSTRVRQIARDGISTAALYHRFGSRSRRKS
jgi:hypothetical protein